YLYGTNKQFLEYFGLRSLQDLPRLEEFPALLERAEARQDQLDLEMETPVQNNIESNVQKDEINESDRT
ncbi:MAG: SMC-Scp complex subunit ScpB, partial [Candidatus Omnitrophica bacterium]|nr:SMC-Scp complex subunit ScpB [Candidatus Omnitrophota bacterium]